jgi:hypothetical protein
MKRLQNLEEGNTEKIIKELQDNGCQDCSPSLSPIDIQNIYNKYTSVKDSNPGFFISRNNNFGIDYDIPTVWTIADLEKENERCGFINSLIESGCENEELHELTTEELQNILTKHSQAFVRGFLESPWNVKGLVSFMHLYNEKN